MKNSLKLGGLFAGIGGFELAAIWAGITPVWSNEIDPFACKVLRKNFNHEIIENDIRKIKPKKVDIITGGFPCQPFSHAGSRKGTKDDRYLWPEMLRIIREVGPSWVVGENVAGLKSMENGETIDRILTDLEDIGYNTETFLIPACGVGAWHRRNRIWIVARNEKHASHTNANGIGSHREEKHQQGKAKFQHEQKREPGQMGKDVSDTISQRGCSRNANWQDATNVGQLRGSEVNGYWDAEPSVGRVANGIPNRVDRLKGLGNAIVPQVAYEIFKAILLREFDN